MARPLPWNWVGMWRHRHAIHTRKCRPNQDRRPPAFESLEARRVLNYDVSIVGDTLQIADTGIAPSNLTIFFNQDTGGYALVDPTKTFNESLPGVDGNGSTLLGINASFFASFPQVQRVLVSLNDGDDLVRVGSTFLPSARPFIVDGGLGSDTIVGSPGDDAVSVEGLDNATVVGISFSNVEAFDGGEGSDSVVGTAGDDRFSLVSNNKGFGQTGFIFENVESFLGNGGVDTVVATAVDDSVSINGIDNTSLLGIALIGVDVFDGGGGTDTVVGTVGNDTFTLTGNKAGIGTSGFGFANVEVFAGNGGIDTVIGTAGNDAFSLVSLGVATGLGMSFNDIAAIDGGSSGIDTIIGTAGDELVSINGLNGASLLGITYSDVEAFDGAGGTDTVDGTAGNDAFTLTGNEAGTGVGGFVFRDVEVVAGNGGTDTVIGTAGDDAFSLVSLGVATGLGMSFNDIAAIDGGSSGIDTVIGTAGDELVSINGLNGASLLGMTYSGVEAFDGAGGTDTVDGTAGNDAFTLTGNEAGTGVGGFVFRDVEVFAGNGGIDTVIGTAGDELVSINGLNGASLLGITYSGVEAFDGAGGTDTVDGTAGNDAFTLTGNEAGTGVGGFVFRDVEVFAGNGGIDTVIGTAGDELVSINGLNGASLLGITYSSVEAFDGAGGTDTVDGTAGNDAFTLTGNEAGTGVGAFVFRDVEVFAGNGGIDTIIGTAGDELFSMTGPNEGSVLGIAISNVENLDGSAGNDRFEFNGPTASIAGSLIGGQGVDTLRGRIGSDDVINITSIAGGSASGSYTQIGSGFVSIESFDGGGGDDGDTLRTNSSQIEFHVTDADRGDLNGSVLWRSFVNLSGLSTFRFDATGSVARVDGQSLGSISFATDRTDLVTVDSVNVTGASGTTNGAIRNSFRNIIRLIGGEGATADTLQGTQAGDLFSVTGDRTGSLNSVPPTTSIAWSEFETLDGRAGDDAFEFTDLGSMPTILGGVDNDTIRGKSTADTFDLTGPGTGSITANSLYVRFQTIESLDGRAGDDVLELNATNASIDGTFNGGTGTDSIRGRDLQNDLFTIDVINGIGANGSVGRSTGNVGDLVRSFVGVEIVDGRGNEFSTNGDTIQSTQGNDLFAITGNAEGTLNGTILWRRIENLAGREGNDTFDFSDAGFVVSIAGDQGTDTLLGKSTQDRFDVNNAGAGTAQTGSLYANFQGLEQIDGRASGDRFIVGPTGSIVNLFGGLGDDTFEIQGNPLLSGQNAFGRVGVAGAVGIDAGEGRDTLIGGNDLDRFVVLSSAAGSPPFGFSVSGQLLRKRDGATFDDPASFETKVTQFANVESLDGARPTGLEVDLAALADPQNCRIEDRGDIIDMSQYAASGIRFNFNGRVEAGNVLVGLLQPTNSSSVLATYTNIESAIGTRFADEFLKTFTADGRPFSFDSVFAGGPGIDIFRTRNNATNDVLFRSGDNLEDTDPPAIDPRCNETGDGIDGGNRDLSFSAPAGAGSAKEGRNIFYDQHEFANRTASMINYTNYAQMVRAMVRYMYITLIDVDGLTTPGLTGTGQLVPGLRLDAAESFWTEFAIRNQLSSFELVRLFLATDVLLDNAINFSQTEDSNPNDGRPDPLPVSQQVRNIEGLQDFSNSFFRANGLAARAFGYNNFGAADSLVQRIRRGETLGAVARSQGINYSTPELVDRLIRSFTIQSVYNQMNPASRRFDITNVPDPSRFPTDPEGVAWRRVFNVLNTGGNWLTALEQILNTPEFLQRAVDFTRGTLQEDSDAFAAAQASVQTRTIPKSFYAILGSFDRGSASYAFDSNGNLRTDSPVSDQQVDLNGGLYRQPIDPTNSTTQRLVGDWNGDGITDLGIFDGRTGLWYRDTNRSLGLTGASQEFRNRVLTNVPSDSVVSFGARSDTPVPGDWNGDGKDDLGVARNVNGSLVWYLDTNGTEGWQSGDSIISFGVAGDIPIVGDWNGDRIDDVGVVRFENGNLTWYLDSNGIRGWQSGDSVIRFGTRGDVPVTADWDGNGTDNIGVYRASAGPNGTWYLDRNGQPGWQGSGAGDIEVTTYRVDVASGALPMALNVSKPLLQQSAVPAKSGKQAGSITQSELDAIVDAAISIWNDVGLTVSQYQQMKEVTFRIVDLPGSNLGSAWKAGVAIDTNAAGHGWFVDQTPRVHEEFTRSGMIAKGGPAQSRIDLLSVVLHELGHIVGLDDDDGADEHLMSSTLPLGLRRLPTPSSQTR
jgi:hypothetical protein